MQDILNAASSPESRSPFAAEEIPCPLCGSNGKKRLGTFHLEGQVLGVVECTVCSLVYMSPRLSKEILKTRWGAAYAEDCVPERIAFWRRNKRLNIEQDMNLLSSLLPGDGRVLDVGCGFGFLLERARAEGYQVMGTEISRPAWEFATGVSGLSVQLGTLQELELAPDSFSAIVCTDALYYLIDPLADLLEMNRILRHEGFIIVRTFNRIAYARCWQKIAHGVHIAPNGSFDDNPFFPKAHLAHFDRRSLELILKRAGFVPVAAYNARMTYWANLGLAKRGLHKIANTCLDMLRRLSGQRWCLAPSVTIVARKP